MSELANRIESRIREIRASNPGYISMSQNTLADLLDYTLLRSIANVAADEAEKFFARKIDK